MNELKQIQLDRLEHFNSTGELVDNTQFRVEIDRLPGLPMVAVLLTAERLEPDGKHLAYVDVVDRYCNRVFGSKIKVHNTSSGSQYDVVIDKPVGEFNDVVIWTQDHLNFSCIDVGGAPVDSDKSEMAKNVDTWLPNQKSHYIPEVLMGLLNKMTTDTEGITTRSLYHERFLFTWMLVEEGYGENIPVPDPPIPPTPEPPTPPEVPTSIYARVKVGDSVYAGDVQLVE